MLGRLVNVALQASPAAAPWGDTLATFREADWSFCNLECVISDHVPRRLPDKAFHFRSDRKNIGVLRAAGIKAVSVANNHCLDCGDDAMLDMLAVLDGAGICHAGAGANLEEAMRPGRFTCDDGTTIGLLACTDNEPDWAAAKERPGVWFVPTNLDDPRCLELLESVRALRMITDLAVVSLHWGSNWGRVPEPGHRQVARALVNAGADLVFGHSCHVFRGLEVLDRSLIVYSAGNFIDDYAVDPCERNDESFLFSIEAGCNGLSRLVLIPTLISDRTAVLAQGLDAARILQEMGSLCARYGTPLTIRQRMGTVGLQTRRARVSHG